MQNEAQSPVNRLILGDNLEIMKTLESESVDLINTPEKSCKTLTLTISEITLQSNPADAVINKFIRYPNG
ncbi:MAG: hypothetical protein LBI05_08825 [Planctomycetaceae bacterium]|jgi:hypothetical protein|nr:hypothetical protein [Planctomycetaceae bacterium]